MYVVLLVRERIVSAAVGPFPEKAAAEETRQRLQRAHSSPTRHSSRMLTMVTASRCSESNGARPSTRSETSTANARHSATRSSYATPPSRRTVASSPIARRAPPRAWESSYELAADL